MTRTRGFCAGAPEDCAASLLEELLDEVRDALLDALLAELLAERLVALPGWSWAVPAAFPAAEVAAPEAVELEATAPCGSAGAVACANGAAANSAQAMQPQNR